MNKLFLLISFLLFYYLILNGQSQGNITPEDLNKQPALTSFISLYQNHIGPIRGSYCQMYPSCSNYGLQAFKYHNPFIALSLTSDRLLRCSHDFKFYDLTLHNNHFKLLDLASNDPTLNKQLIYKRERLIFSHSDPSFHTYRELHFIQFLINKQNHREALLEINRLLFGNDHSKMIPELYTNYLVCKRALNEHERGIFDYNTIFPDEIKSDPNLLVEVGNLHLELDNWELAREFYDLARSYTDDQIIIDKTYLLSGFAYAKAYEWEKASGSFDKVSNNSFHEIYAKKNLKILSNLEQQKFKKPGLAGTLGTVPGLGYLYAGHKNTAISSLIVNGLFIGATFSSIKAENYGLSALVGTFAVSFYIGNISGSVKSAKRYNTSTKEKFIKRINSNMYY